MRATSRSASSTSDFFTNRMFRQTLLCHAELPLGRVLDDAALEALVLSSPARPTEDGFLAPDGAIMRTADPLVAAAMASYANDGPNRSRSPTYSLPRRGGRTPSPPGATRSGLRRVLLDAHLAHFVVLSAPPLRRSPPTRAGDRWPARWPAPSAGGRSVLSTLIPGNLPLDDETDRRLLRCSTAPATTGVRRATRDHPRQLDQALQRLARHGLISR